MRRTASRVSLAVVVAIASAVGAEAIEHIGFSKEDRFIECAGRVFGKPVLLGEQRTWPTIDTVPCPAPSQALVEALKKHGHTVVDCDAWVHLAPSYLLEHDPVGPNVLWKQLRVALKVDEWGGLGSRKLSPAERDRIAKIVIEQARPPISYTPQGRDPASNDANKVNDTISLVLLLDARTLGKGHRESIIATWGQRSGMVRLIYGEMENGVYRPLWDSPHFGRGWLRMGHLDVDADGVEEIILEAPNGRDGMEWVIFNVKGEEISRQVSCESQKLDRGSVSPGITCPIGGKRDPGIKWDQRPNGKRDLIVEDWDGRRWGAMRYRLVNGRYVLQTARHPVRKARPN